VILIGTSGWMYDHWRGILYPRDLPQEELLGTYAESFHTVEVNNTFYRLPSAGVIEAWERRTPTGFLFAIKANRYITHMRNLLEPEQPVRRMMDVLQALGTKLGPILFQLPPGWHVNADRLAEFVAILPQGRRHAFEFRHESWHAEPVYDVLERSGSAFCIHDHKDAPSPRRVTAGFVYVRFHGRRGGYAGKYTTRDISRWAELFAGWQAEGLDVYGYFNNDFRGHAVENARQLIAQLELE
jgi:uncharacterized protein YecE (DUF72 family)